MQVTSLRGSRVSKKLFCTAVNAPRHLSTVTKYVVCDSTEHLADRYVKSGEPGGSVAERQHAAQ